MAIAVVQAKLLVVHQLAKPSCPAARVHPEFNGLRFYQNYFCANGGGLIEDLSQKRKHRTSVHKNNIRFNQ